MRAWQLIMALIATVSAGHALGAGFTFDTTFDARGAANATNNTVKTYAGDPNKIKDNLAQPLMSATPLTAFNGQQFSANLGCQSSNAFLQLLIAPGATGDITSTTVMQDLNMDGVVDRVYALPVIVSGICANGIIACNAGTWSSCAPYAWNADAAGNLSLSSTILPNLGGCYCINNYCGASLVMANLSKALGDMGGGAASAMAAANPLYAISNVTIDGPSIRYYGQDMSRCGQPGNAAVSGYFTNPNAIGGDAATAAPANNVYSLLTNSPAAQATASPLAGATGFVQSCQIVATARVTEVPKVCGQDGNYSVRVNHPNGEQAAVGSAMCSGGQLSLNVATTDSLYWSTPGPGCENSNSGWVNATGWTDGTAVSSGNNGQIEGRLTQVNSTTFLLERLGQVVCGNDVNGNTVCGDSAAYVPYDPNTGTGGNYTINGIDVGTYTWNTVNICGGASGSALYSANLFVPLTPSCDPNNVTTTVNDACAAYATNPRCNLLEETVDGVATYRNYNPTGLSPLPSTQMATGDYCAFPVTREWWVRDRKYLCRQDGTYSFDTAWQRIATVKDSASTTGYNDYRLDPATGTWVTDNNRALSMPPTPPAQTCMPVCKTRKLRVANDAALAGVSQDPRTSNTVYDFYYHECGQDNTCPAATGEEILKACQCVNDFAEVTAIMQSMRLAGKDLICTSGALTPLQ